MPTAPMGLGSFIIQNHDRILGEWVDFARGQLPWAKDLSEETLRDHGDELLSAVVIDMRERQSVDERSEKSKGRRAESALAAVGRKHAAGRLHTGLTLKQLVAEYRSLRASVLRLWAVSQNYEDKELARFNEAIDETLSESVSRYSEAVDSTREQFLAILGHDLRNPLGAIMLSASVLMKAEGLDDAHSRMATRIFTSGERMRRLVHDLLDFTRTRLGGDIPLSPSRLNLVDLCRQVVAELEATYPSCVMRFDAPGDLYGEWDGDRLSQAMSNIVANAVEYGCDDGPIDVSVLADGDAVVVRVHNEGSPIPVDLQRKIFEPMVRQRTSQAANKNPSGLGLGLYIAQQIVTAHGGSISVTSAEGQGTTFAIRIPAGPPSANRGSSA